MASTLLVDNIKDLAVVPTSSANGGNFTYVAYADNTAGTGFTTTFSSTKLYYAIITSTVEIPGLSSSDFTGKWLPVPGKDIARNYFTYIAFADKVDGTGFTTTYSEGKEYFALKISTTVLTSPSASNFAGLWQPTNQYPNTPEYDNVAFLHTDKCNWNTNGMAYGLMTPGAYHYKGVYNRIYFVIFDYPKDAGGVARSGHTDNISYVGFYDLDNKAFSPLAAIPHVYPNSSDLHDMPTILVTDDGHIIIAQEELNGPTGSHNSPMEIWRSNAPEQIALPATPTVHAFTKITSIGNSTTLGLSYPNLILGPNLGEVYLFTRVLLDSTYHGYLYATKSIDNGATWGTPYPVASAVGIIAGPDDWYFYPRAVLGKRENGLVVVGLLNEGGVGDGGISSDGSALASRYKVSVYLYSADGVTFGNIKSQFGTAGAFSRDIITTGMITPGELLANCTFFNVASTLHRSADIQDAGTDINGIPYIMVREWERWASSDNPDYASKDNLIIADHLLYFNTATNAWVDNTFTGVIQDSYEVTAADLGKMGIRASRTILNIYSNGVIDLISRRSMVDDDFYAASYPHIDSASKALRGGIFKITAIDIADNFGEGNILGDFYVYGTANPTFNATNTLAPIEEEIVFFRSLDKGVTWTEVREPILIKGDNYATNNAICTGINNSQNDGYVGVFLGVPKPLPAGTAYDHSELCLVWDKVRTQ